MIKICLIGDGQGWVVDEIAKDFSKFTTCDVVNLNEKPDVVWFVSLFDYFKSYNIVPNKSKVVVSTHHINEDKIHKYNFRLLSKANVCIVPNDITRNCMIKNSCLNISSLPYWLLSNFLKQPDPNGIRKMQSLVNKGKELLIGSFVKDGDGKLGSSPKLSKGPDIFLDIINQVKSITSVKVVLGGWARQYVINGLEKMNVKYVYLNRVKDINSFYDILDWYLVTSRFEGGPQAVLEASYRKIKILSTEVGIARNILHPRCICKNVTDFVSKIANGEEEIDYNYNKVRLNYLPNIVIPQYDKLFGSL